MVYTRILFAGLVAGVVMGMVEMLFSALLVRASGHRWFYRCDGAA